MALKRTKSQPMSLVHYPGTTMKPIKMILCSGALLPLLAPAATLIHAGTVITAEGTQVLRQQTLVVEGDKISGIESGYRQPGSGDTLIDLSKHTVLPGLMDMHTHFSYQSSPTSYS
jgi:imidazolonepropionase-like amidohydrolase